MNWKLKKLSTNSKNKTSSGFDLISNNILKDLKTSLRYPLSIICSKSLTDGDMPNLMKIAKIKPLFKNGSKTLCDNYRPISLLPVYSKILERVVLKRLQNHMHINKHYSDCQFGFRKGCSTVNANQKLLGEILFADDNKMSTAAVFLDLRKAFDVADKRIILSKLKKYGFSEILLNWIKSFLSDRKYIQRLMVSILKLKYPI